jgi:transcription termination factor Rho
VSLGSPSTNSEDADRLLRAVDLLSPLALGQRVLVRAAPRSGRTTLLRGLVRTLAAGPHELEVMVLLIDERPEEATRWREVAAEAGAELAVSTAEMPPLDQIATADLALARAKRSAEAGRDAVLVVDSLSRLAVAHGDAAPVKRLFGAGRELSEDGAGSLTVIATVLDGGEDESGVLRTVLTTENALLRLDPELAAAGVVPALDPGECRAAGEDELREPAEMESVRRLRERLAGLDSGEAARVLGELLAESSSNEELLGKL